jgi:hypothetical protein
MLLDSLMVGIRFPRLLFEVHNRTPAEGVIGLSVRLRQ